MACEQFITWRPRGESELLVERANEIIDEYDASQIQLTLRQLYYQFVARNWLANTERNYKRLGDIISNARLAGLIDWSSIDDLGRVPSLPYFNESKQEFVESLKSSALGFSLDRWSTQENYVELCAEKQALSSVLGPIAEKWGIAFSMNRGYTSQTAMYDASLRIVDAVNAGKQAWILYAGDHDPSGEDMVRDLRDRMATFRAEVEVEKIALTIEQVRRFKCPPNPAKMTDSRAASYIKKHGRQSWEIDALDPVELRKIAERHIAELVDKKAMEKVLAQEKRERAEIQRTLDLLVDE